MKQSLDRNQEYNTVSLYSKGKRKSFKIYKLVSDYFLEDRSNRYDCILHINGNKLNDDVRNLKWGYSQWYDVF